jgi:Kef-type K+ transport system membrane component KefB
MQCGDAVSYGNQARIVPMTIACFFAGLCVLTFSGLTLAQETLVAAKTSAVESNLSAEQADTHGHGPEEHELPFSPIIAELGIVIVVAASGRWIAERAGQSPVLGELSVGIVLGNIGVWLGVPFFILVMNLGDAITLLNEVWLSGESVKAAAENVFAPDATDRRAGTGPLLEIMTGPQGPRYVAMGFAIWLFSELGVLLLMFLVGLESQVGELLEVGRHALSVAIVGIVTPFLLGFFASQWLLPTAEISVHLFLAATLCATSVGITARVFRDSGKLQSREAKIILGAAVIDDILGLIILTVVVGIASTGQFSLWRVSQISLLSLIFLALTIICGGKLVGWLIPRLTAMGEHQIKLLFPLALAFFMSWTASMIELAPIVGAFAAGLILREDHFRTDARHTMEGLISPLEKLFAPIFFVVMGMQVDLRSMTSPSTLWLALILCVIAISGKLICGVVAGRGTNRWAVGIGMIPRGEVGLIFASIGKGLGVVSGSTFSAIVAMVIVTTVVTPILLKWSFRRIDDEGRDES